jgi:hypothetical protein
MTKVKSALCAMLMCTTNVPVAVSQQLTQDQVTFVAETALRLCQTIPEARGRQSDAQLQSSVQVTLKGLVGRLFNVGAGVTGSVSQEEYEGLSREATAIALEGDRNCRIQMYDKIAQRLAPVLAPAPAPAPPVIRPPQRSTPQIGERCCLVIEDQRYCPQWSETARRTNQRLVTDSELDTACYCPGRQNPGIVGACP